MIPSNLYPQIVLAGRSALTLFNPSTGQYVKIKVQRGKDQYGEPNNFYFLRMALLDDGEKGYHYVGAYRSDTNVFIPSKKKDTTTRELKIANFLLQAIHNPQSISTLEIQHAGECCRCGRTLTHPESIQTGLGPECFGLVYGVNAKTIREQLKLQLS